MNTTTVSTAQLLSHLSDDQLTRLLRDEYSLTSVSELLLERLEAARETIKALSKKEA